jgi:hypothetical protein
VCWSVGTRRGYDRFKLVLLDLISGAVLVALNSY